MKGVFEISGRSQYDDVPWARYEFPTRYLSSAQACLGDWIVYRETRVDGGRMSYVAVARVLSIGPAVRLGRHYAYMADYLELDRPVPYRAADGRFAEHWLRELPDVGGAGRALRGRAIRTLDDADFAAILNAGLTDTLAPNNAIALGLDAAHADAVTRQLLEQPIAERPIEAVLVNRRIRDAAFRSHVLSAYDRRCAVTGLKIINGGGKAEAQAAHIWPVSEGGPDDVRNGIALSATAHWLFDRHLISLDEEFGLLVAHNRVPSELVGLFPPGGQSVHVPKDLRLRPRPDFVARHRQRFVEWHA